MGKKKEEYALFYYPNIRTSLTPTDSSSEPKQALVHHRI